MTDFSSSPSQPPAAPSAALSAGSPIAGIWIARSPSGGNARQEESRLEPLTPIEREGARYGYRKAGRPFGPGRKGLETWLRLRARARGEAPRAGSLNASLSAATLRSGSD